MCNCGNPTNPNQPRTYSASSSSSYVLVSRSGSTQTFGSRLEADAENARQGYTGIVKPVGS